MIELISTKMYKEGFLKVPLTDIALYRNGGGHSPSDPVTHGSSKFGHPGPLTTGFIIKFQHKTRASSV